MELRQRDVDEAALILLTLLDMRLGVPLAAVYSTIILDMSVSDRNKLLLLKCPDLWTHFQLGLFIDPDHPAASTPIELQAVYQRNYAEALQQLALFQSGREAIRQEPAIMKALEEVAERGMTPEAKEHAEGAMMALSDKELQASNSEGPKHIMLSYQVRADEIFVYCSPSSHWCARSLLQWDSQAMILRIHSSLCRRSYLVWIDT